jgi:hypothetical protein
MKKGPRHLYRQVHTLIESLGSRMKWLPGGAPRARLRLGRLGSG